MTKRLKTGIVGLSTVVVALGLMVVFNAVSNNTNAVTAANETGSAVFLECPACQEAVVEDGLVEVDSGNQLTTSAGATGGLETVKTYTYACANCGTESTVEISYDEDDEVVDGTIFESGSTKTRSAVFTVASCVDDSKCVAEITLNGTTTHYSTIKAALAAVSSGTATTIVLTASSTVTPKITISAGYTITLDLNGYTATMGSYYFQNYGTLEITDTSSSGAGTVSTESSSTNVYCVYNFGTMTMSGGVLLASTTGSTVFAYGIYNCGTMIMSDGTVSASTSGSRADAYGIMHNSSGTATVSGGTVMASTTGTGAFAYGVYGSSTGEVIISGGDITVSGSGLETESGS